MSLVHEAKCPPHKWHYYMVRVLIATFIVTITPHSVLPIPKRNKKSSNHSTVNPSKFIWGIIYTLLSTNDSIVVHAFLWSKYWSPKFHPGGRKAPNLHPSVSIYPSTMKEELLFPTNNLSYLPSSQYFAQLQIIIT